MHQSKLKWNICRTLSIYNLFGCGHPGFGSCTKKTNSFNILNIYFCPLIIPLTLSRKKYKPNILCTSKFTLIPRLHPQEFKRLLPSSSAPDWIKDWVHASISSRESSFSPDLIQSSVLPYQSTALLPVSHSSKQPYWSHVAPRCICLPAWPLLWSFLTLACDTTWLLFLAMGYYNSALHSPWLEMWEIIAPIFSGEQGERKDLAFPIPSAWEIWDCRRNAMERVRKATVLGPKVKSLCYTWMEAKEVGVPMSWSSDSVMPGTDLILFSFFPATIFSHGMRAAYHEGLRDFTLTVRVYVQ